MFDTIYIQLLPSSSFLPLTWEEHLPKRIYKRTPPCLGHVVAGQGATFLSDLDIGAVHGTDLNALGVLASDGTEHLLVQSRRIYIV